MLKKIKQLGPGIMVSAAFIGPGTITTASLAGAGYGYTLLWAIAFSILATLLLQEMAARLGAVAKVGVGEAIRLKVAKKGPRILSFILVIGAISLGNAAYEAGNISGALLGFSSKMDGSLPFNPGILLLSVSAFLLLFIGQYKLIEQVLTWLVAGMGLIFFLCCIMLQPDLREIIKSIFTPVLPENSGLMVIGLIGTTVVPYNLFLHAASVKQKWNEGNSLTNARWDTFISVILGGLITMSILICSAVAFEQGNPQEVDSISGLSAQLTPLLGGWSASFLAFGFLAAGFTSSITAPLAAAYATSEILGWKGGMKSTSFRAIWIVVLGAGAIFASFGIRPISIILFAQVANGLLLPLIAAYLLWIMNDKKLMGKHTNSVTVNFLGLLIIGVTLLLGLKSIFSALGII